jgi:succinoglycan biosynthesis protein ExoM
VAVCALTLERPVGLARLLAGLSGLDSPPNTQITIVIVDNDPEGSAAPVVDRHRSTLPWPVIYAREPRRGIPFARNHAIDAAGDVDFVAFIDDDEVPDRRWLTELLAMQRATHADVVTGPVEPTFELEPAPWIRRGHFFDRRRFRDGEELTWATTSSVLISTRIITPDRPAFDERMALIGGSDTHFFVRARLAGHRMVWADRALVTETIPASRVNVRWLLRRQYRRGTTLTFCLLDLRDSRVRRIRRVGLGLGRIGQGMVTAAAGAVLGRHVATKGLQQVWFGAGLLAGLAGRHYEEYRVIHGR